MYEPILLLKLNLFSVFISEPKFRFWGVIRLRPQTVASVIKRWSCYSGLNTPIHTINTHI